MAGEAFVQREGKFNFWAVRKSHEVVDYLSAFRDGYSSSAYGMG